MIRQPRSRSIDGRASRRVFLGRGLAAAGAAALAPTLAPMISAQPASGAGGSTTLRADVCVIGAGYAGLTAALRLMQGGKSVVVLEARDRIGGRVYTGYLPDGTWLDYGGTWLGPGQDAAYALAREMGVETYPTYDEGDAVIVGPDGNVVRTADVLSIGAFMFAVRLLAVMEDFEELAAPVPLGAPWNAPRAQEIDQQTLAAWIDAQFDESSVDAREMFRTILSGFLTAAPTEVSLLDALHLVAGHGGFLPLMLTSGGDQQDRVKGGAQAIANRVADRLGTAVRLNAPVRAIKQGAGDVTVTADGVTVQAQRAIVTVPLSLAGHISYDPPLPHARTALTQSASAGSSIKILAVYDEPFWRADGLSGASTSLADPVTISLDGSPDTGKPGIIIALAGGPGARGLSELSAEARKGVFIDALVKRFGPKAATTIAYYEHDWMAEEWTRGCFFAHFPPGVLTQFGPALLDPVGRIHWAGTETSGKFHGSIDGAIQSGERAATEVLAELAAV